MGAPMSAFAGAAAVWVAMAYAQRVLLGGGKANVVRGGSAKKKAMALLPLLPLFLYLPWQPGSCHVRALLAMVFLWTAPSKLLLLCRGAPLDAPEVLSASLPSFAAAVLLPVRVVSAAEKARGKAGGWTGVVAEAALLVVILNLYPAFPDMPPVALYALYCLHFYLGLHLAMRAAGLVAYALCGAPAQTQFDRPYASASLREFWARRWNVMVSGVLRSTVYEPALQAMGFEPGRRPPQPPRWARAAAVLAAFALSGLVHELVFVYVSRGPPTGEMTAFFLVHGLANVAEPLARLPRPLSNLAALSFLYATASLFFLRPLRRSGVDRLAIAEYHHLQSAALSPFL